jgi:hypothetical protein
MYRLTVSTSALAPDAIALVEVAGTITELRPAATGGWDRFSERAAGTIAIPRSGEHIVKIRSRDAKSWRPINLRWLKLSRVGS